MEESEAGSYQKAKHDCESWAFNLGSFAMQDKSYQYLAGDLIKIKSGTTYNVPTAFCYHDPDSRTLWIQIQRRSSIRKPAKTND